MDMERGIVCELSGEYADFEGECADFALDETVPDTPVEYEQLTTGELISAGVYDKLRAEQNMPAAIIAGLVVGILCAILWGAVTVALKMQIGYMALAVGAAVGFSVRFFGKGIEPSFQFVGAAIAFVSCVAGNFLSVLGFAAIELDMGYLEVVTNFNYSYLPEVMKESFSVMDLLFYGIAIYEGFRFSLRKVTAEDLQAGNS